MLFQFRHYVTNIQWFQKKQKNAFDRQSYPRKKGAFYLTSNSHTKQLVFCYNNFVIVRVQKVLRTYISLMEEVVSAK
jgi:hypothetical protein